MPTESVLKIFLDIWSYFLESINYVKTNPLTFIWRFLAIIISIRSIYSAILKRLRKVSINPTRKIFCKEYIFVDRNEIFHTIFESIKSNNNVIQLKGIDGIGKTYFLQFFSDVVNKNIPRKLLKAKKIYYLKKFYNKYDAIYISLNLKDEFINTLEDVINIYFKDLVLENTVISFEYFTEFFNKNFKKRKIIWVFDNVENTAIISDINKWLSIYLMKRSRDVVIFGSNNLLKFDIKSTTINMNQFFREDIIEFAKHYDKEKELDVDIILDETQGLPLFVHMHLNNEYDQSYSKIGELYAECSDEIKCYLAIIVIDSFINSKIYNSILFDHDEKIDENFYHITSRLLIQNHFKYFTINKKIRDVLFILIISNNACSHIYAQASKKLFNYHMDRMEIKSKDSLIYYQLICSPFKGFEKKMLVTTDINDYLTDLVKNENYSFLISIGEPIVHLINQRTNCFLTNSLNAQLANDILIMYIKALQFTGKFHKAETIILFYKNYNNICRVSDVNKKDEIDIFYLDADNLHLKNDYNLAIADYHLLYDYCINEKYNDYTFKITYQIAHCQRHQGKN